MPVQLEFSEPVTAQETWSLSFHYQERQLSLLAIALDFHIDTAHHADLFPSVGNGAFTAVCCNSGGVLNSHSFWYVVSLINDMDAPLSTSIFNSLPTHVNGGHQWGGGGLLLNNRVKCILSLWGDVLYRMHWLFFLLFLLLLLSTAHFSNVARLATSSALLASEPATRY